MKFIHGPSTHICATAALRTFGEEDGQSVVLADRHTNRRLPSRTTTANPASFASEPFQSIQAPLVLHLTPRAKMSPIKLEGTVEQFFGDEAVRNGDGRSPPAFIAYNPISDVDLMPWLPRNDRYLIQQWRPMGDLDCSPITKLILMPQRMAWALGSMPVIFLRSNGKLDGQSLFDEVEENVARFSAAISLEQRFKGTVCDSMQRVEEATKGSQVMSFLPVDCFAETSPFFDPDTHYELQSKRALALSGLPTPPAQLVDFDLPEMGWTAESVEENIERAVHMIKIRAIPFALKSNSSSGSKGVTLPASYGRKLSRITPLNAALHPYSLILTELLPGDAICLNFFVTGNGDAIFSSCCGQDMSATNHWLGGTIRYSEQATLADRYAGVLAETARFLHSKGFRGPAGIDVMTGEDGVHQVIDLNPRLTGTFVLGCLRPHFAGELGFDEAGLLPFLNFNGTRNEFESTFEKEIQRGEVLVMAWCVDKSRSRSFTGLCIGAKDRAERVRLAERIVSWVERR
ncbi:hypothetical protein NLG97_g4809 [Lecanicillium saksenae]|uniref:Uncharacterized protein n=1 Tax=Lecanicillium saksenae TaxID=468837 RepID=A0ACC1QXE7_9HYPO|nr:hypothetical protein NLG97_g4809 [Lecanicillium saksenae]